MTMKFFWWLNSKIYSYSYLPRPSDGLANWSFCWSEISRIQLKSNWTVGKRLLASDFRTVWKSSLILLKTGLGFFNYWFGSSFIWQELALKGLWMMSCCNQGTVHTVCWPCEPINLSIGHFEGPTEIERSSSWITVSL